MDAASAQGAGEMLMELQVTGALHTRALRCPAPCTALTGSWQPQQQ